jgi:hypothetical protein
MKHETIKTLIQLSLSAATFLAMWGLLAIAGPDIINEKAVQNWVAKKDWLNFVSPHIRNLLITQWRPLAALLITASLFYPKLKYPADNLAKRYFLKGSLLTLRWGPAVGDLPQPEFLYFFPPGSYNSSGLILENEETEATDINRIERYSTISRIISDLGTEILGIFPLSFSGGERDNVTGLEWKKLSENCWVIDTPFTLPRQAEVELAEVELPKLNLDYDNEDENAVTQLRSLVGLATLVAQFEVSIFTNQGIINRMLSAPLRLLLSLEEEGDGGIGTLVNNLPIKTETERSLLFQAYERERLIDFQIRAAIAQRLNDMMAAKELESANQAIALNPNDPKMHFVRGAQASPHFLLASGV